MYTSSVGRTPVSTNGLNQPTNPVDQMFNPKVHVISQNFDGRGIYMFCGEDTSTNSLNQPTNPVDHMHNPKLHVIRQNSNGRGIYTHIYFSLVRTESL